LDENSKNHYGELVAMDRSIGRLRAGLRDLQIADNTLVWYCSDNGGLPKIKPTTVGDLRGFKGSLYEGGLRVPAVIEWPAGIEPRVTKFPAVSMDIFPTIAELLDLPDSVLLKPQDGASLVSVFQADSGPRKQPIPFACFGNAALIDNDLKLLHLAKQDRYELYDLAADIGETTNLMEDRPDDARRLRRAMKDWLASRDRSVEGLDYPAGRLLPGDPEPRFWMDVEAYRPWFDEWRQRPEYKSRLSKKRRQKR
jgi:arylsulfatase A-like enzyme